MTCPPPSRTAAWLRKVFWPEMYSQNGTLFLQALLHQMQMRWRPLLDIKTLSMSSATCLLSVKAFDSFVVAPEGNSAKGRYSSKFSIDYSIACEENIINRFGLRILCLLLELTTWSARGSIIIIGYLPHMVDYTVNNDCMSWNAVLRCNASSALPGSERTSDYGKI